MSLLVTALPLIEKVLPRLTDLETFVVEHTLDKWLPEGHPRKRAAEKIVQVVLEQSTKAVMQRAKRLPAALGDHEVVKWAFSTKAKNREAYLAAYLKVLDKQEIFKQKKYSRALIKILVAQHPKNVINCALSRKQKNVTTAQFCLAGAESLLKTDVSKAKKLLQKANECLEHLPESLTASETCLGAARCFDVLDMLEEKKKAFVMGEWHMKAASDKERAIYYARCGVLHMVDDCLIAHDLACTKIKKSLTDLKKERVHTKFKIARILHPQYPEKALSLLFEVLPKGEAECCLDWHLGMCFKKIDKFEGSYEAIEKRIKENSQGLQGYTLASVASSIQHVFPDLARKFYKTAGEIKPKLSYRIAIANLSGEKRNERLTLLFHELTTQEGVISWEELKQILNAICPTTKT